MRLVIKQSGRVLSEFKYETGPVSIGRSADNEVVLADKMVSKKHAQLLSDNSGGWTIEDLGSFNKTYLNDKVVGKGPLRTGDLLKISDFEIEVNLDDGGDKEADKLSDTLQMQASLATPKNETLIRRPDASHAPAMRLEAKRLMDFSQATEMISKATSLDLLLPTLLAVSLKQFDAFRVWCALRTQANGPMTFHAGKRRDGERVELDQLSLQDKITQAVDKKQSLVFPRVSAQIQEKDHIRSAMISPIICSGGCLGVIYVDNSMIHEHYSLSDLDYLMLLSIHTMAFLKKLL